MAGTRAYGRFGRLGVGGLVAGLTAVAPHAAGAPPAVRRGGSAGRRRPGPGGGTEHGRTSRRDLA
ncbi:hypothetical protein [Streptomyces venetus]|uniref:hypothetical protein n=1 Tax=Streptomyces venetus TaxID=1701086 RepID=UPI0031EAE217